ncbi:uncharacterized protein LOC141858688 [Brevipalpus obovatus]|uniref:uncharacterized protein LOC141858688 n=1 Tax=Brevipalpus obovatus TaxID=246614 RepID=UPI003D9EEC14
MSESDSRVSPNESENANTGLSSRFDEEEVSYTLEELAVKCDILERTNILLEERILDLEEKNGDLVQANVLLLKENEQMKSDLERQKKEFLIKTTAARKEYNEFVEDIRRGMEKTKQLHDILATFNQSIEDSVKKHDPLYIFDHKFDQELEFDTIDNLNSTRLKSLRSLPEASTSIWQQRRNEQKSRATNLSILEEERTSTPGRGIETPASSRRIAPKVPVITPGGGCPSPIQSTFADWQYQSPPPSDSPLRKNPLSTSLDSIQNFEPKSVRFDVSHGIFSPQSVSHSIMPEVNESRKEREKDQDKGPEKEVEQDYEEEEGEENEERGEKEQEQEEEEEKEEEMEEEVQEQKEDSPEKRPVKSNKRKRESRVFEETSPLNVYIPWSQESEPDRTETSTANNQKENERGIRRSNRKRKQARV